MDHNLSYKGSIWVIQNPNIKLSDRAIISLKDTSPNSHFFPIKISPKNYDSRFSQNRAACGSPEKTKHNLGYRGPIWVIKKPNIKFSDRAIISLKDTSPNSLFF